MKNHIIRSRIMLAFAFLFFCSLMGSVNAQEMMNSSDETSKMMDKKTMSKDFYMIPQKPEDISPLLTGEKIPEAVLSDAYGKKFDLGSAVTKKQTILIFYRGGWCPYCSKQLSGLQEAAPELEKMGYQLIAVSTDAPEGLMKTSTKKKLGFTLLSDADITLIKKVGIAFKAPKGYWDMLPKTTGGKDIDLLLPVPSVFILDKMGRIQFEYINPDFKQRLNPELLKAVAFTIGKNQ